MIQVNLKEAKARLSEYLDSALRGSRLNPLPPAL